MTLKSLIKLIDEAIVPAVILIAVKMLAVLITAYLHKFEFTVSSFQVFHILPTVKFLNPGDYIKTEEYSNLAMFLAAAAGTLSVLIKAHFLHNTHIHPKFQAKLTWLNLESLVSNSYHIYHQAVIWLIFLWLTVALQIVASVLSGTNAQIAIISAVVAANFSWILVADVEREISIFKDV